MIRSAWLAFGAAAASFVVPPALWYADHLLAHGGFAIAAGVSLWFFPALWLEMLIWSVLKHGMRWLWLLALAPLSLFWPLLFASTLISCTYRNACL